MSSKGTPRITVRMCEELRAQIEEDTHNRNISCPDKEPWKMSDWIMAACIEKLNHLRRARKEAGRWGMETAKDGQARPVFTPWDW